MILSGQRVAFLSRTAGNTSIPIPGRYSGWGAEIPRPWPPEERTRVPTFPQGRRILFHSDLE